MGSHPRYFLPLIPFLTLSAALFVEEAWDFVQKSRQEAWQWIFFALLLSFSIASARFQLLSFFTPHQIPFVPDDRSQYLTTWSAGQGIAQIRDRLIQEVNKGQRITVVTEGSFGTLPDGLLLYFDRRSEIRSLRIEGLAQYPVKNIPDWVWGEAADHPTWLVVNANRLELPPEQFVALELLSQYDRPYGAPELQLYQLHPEKRPL